MHGTSVGIVSLTKEWNIKEAAYCIASNFMKAIIDNQLVVTVNENKKSKVKITSKSIRNILEEHQNDLNRSKQDNEILSGKSAWQSFESLELSKMENVALSNGETTEIYVRQMPYMQSIVALVRNGMMIARHNEMLSTKMRSLTDVIDEPFTAVINVTQAKSPVFYRLVKGAETPHHNELKKGKLGTDEEEKLLIGLLDEIATKIKDLIVINENNNHQLPLFQISDSNGEPIKPPEVKRAVVRNQKKRRKQNGKGGKSKTTRPNRILEHKIASKYSYINSKHRLDFKFILKEIKQNELVYVSVALAEDSDHEYNSEYLSVTGFKINGNKKNPDKQDNTLVVLPNLKNEESYHVSTTLSIPQKYTKLKKKAFDIVLNARKVKK